MRSTVRSYQAAVVLLTAALLATLTVALTGGDRADAVDGPVDVVYVATGRNFPDALAGATLATSTNAPLLTVNTALPIPPDTITALEALDPDRIIIFGGSAAVSDEIAGALATYARSGQVTRIEGDDRHGTAAAIANALPDKIADADLLDGLDSTDFLRTTDAAAQKGFALPVGAADVGGGATVGEQALTLPGSGSPTLTLGWALPGGHVSGDTVTVRLAIRSSPNCAIRLSATGVAGPDDESQRMLNYGWTLVGSDEGLVVFGPIPPGDNSAVAIAEFELVGKDLGPGAAMNFHLVRQADDPMDTCLDAFVFGGIAVDY